VENPDGPFCQCCGKPTLHVRRLLVACGMLFVAAHRLDAQRHVTNQRIVVHRRWIARETVGVFAELPNVRLLSSPRRSSGGTGAK
jgi:hypothetical protein